MIFDLAQNFTNYSWDLLPSFGDNEKSAGPPQGAPQGRILTLFKIKKKFKHLFLSVSKSDLIQTWTDRKILAQSFFQRQGFGHGQKFPEKFQFECRLTLGQKIKKVSLPIFFILLSVKLLLVAFIMTPILGIGFELLQRKKIFQP